MRIRDIVLLFFMLSFGWRSVRGCTCVHTPSDVKTTTDLARWYATQSDVIFEATVEDVKVKWTPLDTRVGSLLPTDLDQMPMLLDVTFSVSRTYRGAVQHTVTVSTGVGGGDCGFDFEIGKQYLVYAYTDTSGQLSTNICTGTGLVEDRQASLAYLRGEPFAETAKSNASVPTAKLCGRVVSETLKLSDSQVFLFRAGRGSPVPYDEADPTDDGAFCFSDEKPGSYYLGFINRVGDSPNSFVLFPGVGEPSEATELELKAGETQPELVFNVPPQNTFSVQGNVMTHDGEPLPSGCKVMLLRASLSAAVASYEQDARADGSFDFPHVLPGTYWAFVTIDSDAAAQWLTRKAEIQVNSDLHAVSLDLVRQ